MKKFKVKYWVEKIEVHEMTVEADDREEAYVKAKIGMRIAHGDEVEDMDICERPCGPNILKSDGCEPDITEVPE